MTKKRNSPAPQFYFSLFPLLALSGCFVLIPFIEPYKEPESSAPQGTYSAYSAVSAASKPARRSGSARYLNRYIAQLQDPKPTVRTAAASYIGMLGPQGEPAIPALISRLTDESKFVRRAVVKSLGKIGVRSPEVEDALHRGTKDRDPYVAESARKSLAKLQTRPLSNGGNPSYVMRQGQRVDAP